MQNQSDGGVDYSMIDPAKVLGQKYSRETLGQLTKHGVAFDEMRIGESAPILTFPAGGKYSSVLEGLGTKACMAEFVYEQTGDASVYAETSHCTVAMIVNDLITSGILPVTVQMYFAVGASEWLQDHKRVEAVMRGWRDACIESHAAWIGGETPSLKRVIHPKYADFAGCATGYLAEGFKTFDDQLEIGDRIIGFKSSGVHANGMTSIQDLAEQKLTGYDRVALYKQCLVGTQLYVGLVSAMHDYGICPTRVENITGHGFRKIMRSHKPFTYRIKKLHQPQSVFWDIQTLGQISTRDMFSSYNCGTGFVAFVRPGDADNMIGVANVAGYEAIDMGGVEESPDKKKRVIIEKHDIVFEEDTMSLR